MSDNPKDYGLEGKVSKKPLILPEGVKKPVSVANLEVTVDDATPQPLLKLRPFESMVLHISGRWPKQAQVVLQALFDCFSKAGHVSEGLIGDMVWGFAQCGIPSELTVQGLAQLNGMGFVKFQAPDNNYVTLYDTASEKAWVRYQKPLLDLVYEGSSK